MTDSQELYRCGDFFTHVFGEQDGFICCFSGHRSGNELKATRSAYFSYPGELPPAQDWLRGADGHGHEVYYCAHLLTAKRRVKTNATPLSALYVDGDGAEVPDWLPPPTATVESSPGREQFYWRLSRAVAPEIGETLNHRLALAMGGDKSGWDLTQLLRPPGTRNHKYPQTPPVVLREMTDAAHDPDELDRLLAPLPTEAAPGDVGQGTHKSAALGLGDEEVLHRAARAANGAKFARLWAGNTTGYGSRSEADLALCSILSFWCGPNVEQIERLFRRSGLVRRKWDERHYGNGRTYGQGTVEKALSGRSEFWSGGADAALKRGRAYARRKAAISLG